MVELVQGNVFGSVTAFTASRNFSVTCPSTTGEGIGLPTSKGTCPSNSSGMLAMPRFYARTGLAFLASWRLGERLKKAAMTENAIAKEIVDTAFRIHTTLGPGLLESVYHAVLAYERSARKQSRWSTGRFESISGSVPT